MKQRLVGAVVLIALAVIFVPMFLGGPAERTRVDVPIEVPPEPAVTPEPHLPDTGFADRPAPGGDVPARPPAGDTGAERAVSEPAGSDAEAQADGSAASQPSGDESAAVAGNEAATAAETPAGDGAADASATPATAPEKAGDWAVQVGAFGKEANALGMRDRLRKAGYDVYVDQATGSGGDTIFRVRVGPLGSRDEADGVARRIQVNQDIKGLVVPR